MAREGFEERKKQARGEERYRGRGRGRGGAVVVVIKKESGLQWPTLCVCERERVLQS